MSTCIPGSSRADSRRYDAGRFGLQEAQEGGEIGDPARTMRPDAASGSFDFFELSERAVTILLLGRMKGGGFGVRVLLPML
jgi:hypothetical protein